GANRRAPGPVELGAPAVPARRRERRRQRAHALPLARSATAKAAAEHSVARTDGRRDSARHGGRGVRRHPDADSLEADAGGSARLSRPISVPAGSFLRAPAVAADREAAPRHLWLRALLPDCHLLPR